MLELPGPCRSGERSVKMAEDHVHSEEMARDPRTTPTAPAASTSKHFPLNSKRLTSSYLLCIAKAMRLPTRGTVEETRLIIEGRLREMEREPRNVQVMVGVDEGGGEIVSLRDVSGVFLEARGATDEAEREGGGADGDAEEYGDTEREERESVSPSVHDDVSLADELTASRVLNGELTARNEELVTQVSSLRDTVSELTEKLAGETERVNEMWRMNCAQVSSFDEVITAKDAMIEQLQAKVAALEASSSLETTASHATPATHTLSVVSHSPHARTVVSGRAVEPVPSRGTPVAVLPVRRGKAPPVSAFTGRDPECQLDDWLPSLERASAWNAWTEDEKMMQLAGHLEGRALQEWNSLQPEERASFTRVIEALRQRLDFGSKAVAAQDFRHVMQHEAEPVADFVRRLERTFHIAYGRDHMSAETRDALLYGQLQEGLRLELMSAPAVSGARGYPELCIASKNEEKRLADLKRRREYAQSNQSSTQQRTKPKQSSSEPRQPTNTQPSQQSDQEKPDRRCFYCKKPGHLMRDCLRRKKRSESVGPSRSSSSSASTKQILSDGDCQDTLQTPSESALDDHSCREDNPVHPLPQAVQDQPLNPCDLLLSDSESENDVRLVRVTDSGSRTQLARVDVQGVPADGVVDTAADITIMGGKLFALVASSARLRKKNFKPPDKTPRTYDRKVFRLDGCMEMEISFQGKTMKTTVYIKMDACDQLLLSEGVCRQLGIVTYHPSLLPRDTSDGTCEADTLVPSVRVSLVQTLKIPANRSALVPVRVECTPQQGNLPMFVEGREGIEKETGLVVEDAVVSTTADCLAQLVITNLSGFTQRLPEGTPIGCAEAVDVLTPAPEVASTYGSMADVKKLSSSQEEWRRKKLLEEVHLHNVPASDASQLQDFLAENHSVFSLKERERGETDLVTMTINTGDAPPCKQAPRRMPFIVRQEVAKQLRDMQQDGVIQPSCSPWSSPVVIVRKKDGRHRFCVDYRRLNAVTKADTFPLPRIADLLDQLDGAKYFTTLDLASGFWQIQVEPESRAKTAFVTPQGLYEFLVMPFGLTNAPAVFQRLMHKVLSGLNPEDGKDFVTAYLDDILIFSNSLSEHLYHLRKVIDSLKSVNLKLQPSKCKFARTEVEYLGHVITAEGLKPNVHLTDAVRNFPRPQNVQSVRRFLGMASFYRRFIAGFAKIAQPLYHLTAKNVPFLWSAECESAFIALKTSLVTPPVLAYPCFSKDFTLETDASIQGLGAVLSQKQEDGKLHPVAYASRSLNQAERNYSVTELETLAVVWGITHFHSYVYGKSVTVLTDHSAVKSVLETSNPSGKHARWWTRVYGTGVGSVKIVYRAGRENASADALSRSPTNSPPSHGVAEGEVQVAAISTSEDFTSLLQLGPASSIQNQKDYSVEQLKDPSLKEVMELLGKGKLPDNPDQAVKVMAQESQFSLLDGTLYYIDHRHDNRRRIVVPCHLREQLLSESHRGPFGGHFSGPKVYKALVRHWWWPGMYADVISFCRKCPDCAIVTGATRQHRPPLRPIPVERPFQKIGVDIMDLPCTARGNKHVVVFQDMLTKWPMVFPVPDQKTEHVTRLLCEEIVPMFGVPEALLSDRGTNLLSHLMLDVCALLGIEKLNTTSYHPECDGMIERFNRTLKTMLRKRANQFGVQWDNHLAGILWAYRNTPHDATGEKPSFLLFGWDCRSPTEAALLPIVGGTSFTNVQDELVLTLSSARQTALETIRKSQQRYKAQYDHKTDGYKYRVGDWVLIRFPGEETGRLRKLSRPWHGPYRITSCNDTNVTAVKVYFPLETPIQVHQLRVKPCPDGFSAGYYWYGHQRKGPGRPPKWVEALLSDVGSDTLPEEDTTAAHTSECDNSGTSGNDVGEAENMSLDEAAVEDDREVSDDSDSHVAGPDSPVGSTCTGAVGSEDQDADTQRRPLRYSLRAERRPPDRLL